MSDAPVGNVLPPLNIEIIREIRHFVVENVRTARRFLKRCDPSINIDGLRGPEGVGMGRGKRAPAGL